jgi:sialate O-acetylesterase
MQAFTPLFALLALAAPLVGLAKVQPADMFTDHMVIQRDTVAPVWGTAAAGEQVTVTGSWAPEVSVATTAGADGKWRVDLQTPPAGGPYTLTIEGNNTITITDVLSGDVWLCSGQSNMAWSLDASENSAAAIAAADYPNLRLFNIKPDQVGAPLTRFRNDPAWSICTPTSATDMSAVGYYFGRKLWTELNVPIGLISCAFSGKPIEDFLPEPVDARKAYNAIIHPQVPFAIRGVIWYQGETNLMSDGIDGSPLSYVAKKKELITSWRALFGSDFPFYYVQLAPYNYSRHGDGGVLPYFWEAQARVMDAVPGTGMVVITDVGNPGNIHPTNKEVPGTRLALLALGETYRRDVVSTGPVFQSFEVIGNTMEVSFDSALGLSTSDGAAPDGFELAAADEVYYPATATIRGDQVLLSSPHVTAPIAMRFAWSELADPNLRNGAGLLASAFRAAIPTPPVFGSDPMHQPEAYIDVAYTESIALDATDLNGDPLSFSKLSGPEWLSVGSDGSLSGTPVASDFGANTFRVQVDDGQGGSATATLNLTVKDAPSLIAHFDFESYAAGDEGGGTKGGAETRIYTDGSFTPPAGVTVSDIRVTVAVANAKQNKIQADDSSTIAGNGAVPAGASADLAYKARFDTSGPLLVSFEVTLAAGYTLSNSVVSFGHESKRKGTYKITVDGVVIDDATAFTAVNRWIQPESSSTIAGPLSGTFTVLIELRNTQKNGPLFLDDFQLSGELTSSQEE